MTRTSSLASIPRRGLTRLRSESRILMARHDLIRLAALFNTDKDSVHGYMEHYARHFSGRRQATRSVLEIGIGPGGSLKMWRVYFPKATIYGMDLRAEERTERRTRILQGDQGRTEDLVRVADTIGTIDVIIDDGSHVNGHVRSTFDVFFPHLGPGGCYVIEDLHAAYKERFGGAAPGVNTEATSIGLVKTLLDGLHHEHFPIDGYTPTYTDTHVDAVHAYEKIAFIEKRREDAT